jgi:hypothetical protein
MKVLALSYLFPFTLLVSHRSSREAVNNNNNLTHALRERSKWESL